MKNISQQEFEQYIWEMIRGEKTQTTVVKELETDHRTLNNRIQKLSVTNPELHKAYVESRPYKPKERKDINAVELALEVLREEKTLEQIAESYGAGMRTIRRKIDSLKKSEDALERELYTLCKAVAYNHSHSIKNDVILQNRIMEVREILSKKVQVERRSNIEIRRQELLKIEKEYQNLRQTMSEGQAAAQMGYTTNRIYKLLNELYRIEIELRTSSKQSTVAKKEIFRQSLKAQTNPGTNSISSNTVEDKNTKKNTDKEKGKQL